MKCVDDHCTTYIADACNTDELVERMHKVMMTLEGQCLAEMALVSGLALGTLHVFKRNKATPKVDTINAMLKFLAPGYTVGIVPAARPTGPMNPLGPDGMPAASAAE